jgi:hypothetical protein
VTSIVPWYFQNGVIRRYGYSTSPPVDPPIDPPPSPFWGPDKIVSQPRPTGPGYVTYESLYTPGNTLSQVVYKVPLDGSGKPQVLTLPPNQVWEISGFNDGFFDGIRIGQGGALGCRGIAGSGFTSIIRPKANSATQSNGPTIAGVTLRLEKIANPVFTNLRLEGTPQSLAGQQLYYGGFTVSQCTGTPEISWLQLRGASPGYANSPPGETFGINIFKTHNCLIHDLEIDGRDNAGTRVAASPFGWNGSSMTDPVLNAQVKRVYAHHALAGMPTFWQTFGVDTEDLWSYSNGTSNGGLLGHQINHEQTWGRIRHLRPHLTLFGAFSPEAGHTNNTGTHFSVLNASYDAGADFVMTEPVWDHAHGPTGMLIMAGYNGYTGGISGGSSKLVTAPTVIKNGVSLGHTTHPNSGWSSADPTKFYAWVH